MLIFTLLSFKYFAIRVTRFLFYKQLSCLGLRLKFRQKLSNCLATAEAQIKFEHNFFFKVSFFGSIVVALYSYHYQL